MYKKTLIRQFIVALLKAGVVNVSNRVYGGRVNPKNDEDYPYISVYTRQEDVGEGQFTSHTSRVLQLFINAVVKDNSKSNSDFDEVVENLMFDVESTIGLIITNKTKIGNDNFVLFNSIQIVANSIDNDNSSSNDIGSAVLTYEIKYDYEEPVVPIDLLDFDIEGSIDNIIITNPGVPQ